MHKCTSGMMPLDRICTLEDVASVGIFLASNSAKHFKGEIIEGYGGMVIK